MLNRQCKSCREFRSIDEFYACNRVRCKECVKAAAREYRQNNIERVRAYDRVRGLDPQRKAEVKTRAPRYKDRHAAWVRANNEENPERRAARVAVGNAIRDGKLKVQPCERCGYAVGVHAHHEDYSKPLDVTWLCSRCHGERHREINEEKRKAGP